MVTLRTTKFNIHKFYILPTECIYVGDLRTNSDHFPAKQQLSVFYNPDAVWLLRGTIWNFKYNTGHLRV